MPEIYVAVRSYKRPGAVKTLTTLPSAHIWVPESQGDAYRAFYGDQVVTIPDSEDGSVMKKSNSILNRAPSEWILMVDDDITSMGYYERGKHYTADQNDVLRMAQIMFEQCEAMGVELWGVNQKMDPLVYRALCPFSLLAPILGPFHGHIRPSLRYDEKAGAKEDYDFWLQNIRKFHRTWRNNKWHYVSNHGTQQGGLVSKRTMAFETESAKYMIQKWGRELYRLGGQKGGKSATGDNVLNSVVHVPIKGT